MDSEFWLVSVQFSLVVFFTQGKLSLVATLNGRTEVLKTNIVGANTLRNVKVYMSDDIPPYNKIPNVSIRNFFILENDPDFQKKKKRI